MERSVDHGSAKTAPKYTPEYLAEILDINLATLRDPINAVVRTAQRKGVRYRLTARVVKIGVPRLIRYVAGQKEKLWRELYSRLEDQIWSTCLIVNPSDHVKRGSALQLKPEIVADMIINWAEEREMPDIYIVWQDDGPGERKNFGIRAFVAQFAQRALEHPSQVLDEKLENVHKDDYKDFFKKLWEIWVDDVKKRQRQILILVHCEKPNDVVDMAKEVGSGYPGSPAFIFVIVKSEPGGPEKVEASGLCQDSFWFERVSVRGRGC